MIDSIDGLLKQYELGKMTRRELLAAISLLLAPARSSAQDGLFRGRSLNHLNIRVTDVRRSESFYRSVLGLPAVRTVVGPAFALDFPAVGARSGCGDARELEAPKYLNMEYLKEHKKGLMRKVA